MKTKTTKPAPRAEILTADIRLADGRMLRKQTFDQLWHLYPKSTAAGYTRVQQGEVRALLGGAL